MKVAHDAPADVREIHKLRCNNTEVRKTTMFPSICRVCVRSIISFPMLTFMRLFTTLLQKDCSSVVRTYADLCSIMFVIQMTLRLYIEIHQVVQSSAMKVGAC